jgi:hypothetical protein
VPESGSILETVTVILALWRLLSRKFQPMTRQFGSRKMAEMATGCRRARALSAPSGKQTRPPLRSDNQDGCRITLIVALHAA